MVLVYASSVKSDFGYANRTMVFCGYAYIEAKSEFF